MIEQHDALMRELRGGRAAPRPRLRPARGSGEPEGVALYQCHQPVPHAILPVDGHPELAETTFHPCGKGVEAKPYEPIPMHCDAPMALVGYDWERDVAEAS